jgi:protein O-GlcNAc transferase
MPSSTTTELMQEAIALQRRGAIAEAAARYEGVLRVDPNNPDAYYYLGMMSCQTGRFDAGVELARKALASDARHVNAHILLGRALGALGHHEEAIEALQQAVALGPNVAGCHSHLADALSDLGRKAEAVHSYDQALALMPDCVEDWFNRGLALDAIDRREEALESFDRAIAAKPDVAQVHLARANVLWRLRRSGEVLESVNRALALDPESAEAWHSRGNIHHDLRQYDYALADYDKALALKPELAEAWLGRGNALRECERYEKALTAYEEALARKPGLAQAWLGRGNVFFKLRRHEEASHAYNKALELKSDLAEAWLGHGAIFSNLRQHEKALAAYDRALALKPNFAAAWFSRATTAVHLEQYGQAFLGYHNALTFDPNLDYAEGLRLVTKLYLCDWTELATEIAQVLARVKEGEAVSVPSAVVALPSSAADQLRCAERYVKGLPTYPPIWVGESYSHDRIRVAYLSADFRHHPTAYLTAGLFEDHDRSRFEITGISIGPSEHSDLRRRLEAAFEHFIDAKDKTEADIANLIRDCEIDIAVDLMGHVRNSQLGILVRRPAPIQVNFLGYPGTTGADCMDYIIADPTIIPKDHFPYYSERVVWLPDTYQANDRKRRISERRPTRNECGLPEAAFVFCCFNNAYKIMPEIFAIWLNLLAATEDSVLWLIKTNATAEANLRREIERRGIASERLIFAPTMPLPDHLARMALADLYLDTLPYNAHTGASDALWAGLPVLTCLGETFAGRVAASLLRAVGLPELITTTLDEYEALALKFSSHPTLRASIKAKLAGNRDIHPLFDTARFTRHIEAAYTTMWQRQQRGEPPAAFAVERMQADRIDREAVSGEPER